VGFDIVEMNGWWWLVENGFSIMGACLDPKTQPTTSCAEYGLVVLRVTCWRSCVFCRGTLSALWVVLELVWAH
jgi:hypothetical protein